MGNQSYNIKYAQARNWIKPNPGINGSIVQAPNQGIFVDNRHNLSNSTVSSNIKAQTTDEKNMGSKINLPLQPQLRHSAIGVMGRQPPLEGSKHDSLVKWSNTGNPTLNQSSIIEPPVKTITVKPEISKTGSILQKNQVKKQLNLKIDSFTERIDDLRVSLRASERRILREFLPSFEENISEMNELIETERRQKLKDKNKVMFLLKQKRHHHKLGLKFKDFEYKIKDALLTLRKKDSIHQITQSELASIIEIQKQVQQIITKIQKQLPQLGWKVVITKPTSDYYMSVVAVSLKDPDLLTKYHQLQQSLTSAQVLQQIVNQEMLYSKNRRVDELTIDQISKKLIEGPADYRPNSSFTKGIKRSGF